MDLCPKEIPAPQSQQQVKKTMALWRLQARPSTVLLCCPRPQRAGEGKKSHQGKAFSRPAVCTMTLPASGRCPCAGVGTGIFCPNKELVLLSAWLPGLGLQPGSSCCVFCEPNKALSITCALCCSFLPRSWGGGRAAQSCSNPLWAATTASGRRLALYPGEGFSSISEVHPQEASSL